MKKILLTVLLLMLVAVSGCSNGINFNQNAGAVIQNAGFDFDKIYDDEQTSLMFDVSNVGGKKIDSGVSVYVYGPTFGNVEETWSFESSGNSCPFSLGNGYLTATLSDLPPPDPELGTPGGTQSCDILLTPAKVLDGVEVATDFHIRLCFPYMTETITQVEVTSKNELRATGVRSTRDDTINAAGPIHVNVMGDGNIRSGGKIPLIFEVRDVGGGFSTLDGDCVVDQAVSDRYKVSLEVTIDGTATGVQCGSAGSSSGEVKLKDGVGTFYCTYAASSDGSDVIPRRTYMVKAVAKYQYYVTKDVTVKNIGSTLDTQTS